MREEEIAWQAIEDGGRNHKPRKQAAPTTWKRQGNEFSL